MEIRLSLRLVLRERKGMSRGNNNCWFSRRAVMAEAEAKLCSILVIDIRGVGAAGFGDTCQRKHRPGRAHVLGLAASGYHWWRRG